MANGSQTVSAVITADAKPFKKSVYEAGKSFDGFGAAAKNAGVIAAAAFALAAGAAANFLIDSAKAAAEAEAIGRGLENAAENAGVFASQAGGIAGATEALKDYATQLGETIGKDDEALLKIVTGWLAVPDLAALGTDGLNNLLKVSADVAAGTGKDLDTVAAAFTKISDDGETAFSRLSKMGAILTDDQKAVYQSLLDANDEMGAQQFLIDTLGEKYAGAAEAIANPFDRMKVIFGNFQEEIGAKLLPVFEALIPKVQEFLDGLLADPEFMQFIEDLGESFVDFLPYITDLLPPFMDLVKVLLPAMGEWLPVIGELLKALAEAFGGAESDGKEYADMISNMADAAIWLIGAVQALIGWFVEQFKIMDEGGFSILGLIAPITTLVANINDISTALEGAIGWWNDLWGISNEYAPGIASNAAMADRRLSSTAGAAAAGASRATYNVSVNAIAPTAEVGRAVVDSLRAYNRIGGQTV